MTRCHACRLIKYTISGRVCNDCRAQGHEDKPRLNCGKCRDDSEVDRTHSKRQSSSVV